MPWTLHIGNKRYSSWSMRPWILLRQFGIPFDEVVTQLFEPTSSVTLQRHSPTGKVPALVADGLVIWDSLSIIEFVAEARPDLAIWPRNRAARAMARSLAAEMHSGFLPLRRACPTNFQREPRAIDLTDEVRADVARLETAWAVARAEFGGDGPFLFGEFTAADAMFAPVANRVHTYSIPVSDGARDYLDSIMALPAWTQWIREGAAEPWRVERFEQI